MVSLVKFNEKLLQIHETFTSVVIFALFYMNELIRYNTLFKLLSTKFDNVNFGEIF